MQQLAIKITTVPYSPIELKYTEEHGLKTRAMDLELFKEVILNVNWNNEPWLWGLAGFHATTCAFIIITRGRPYLQAVIFCILALLCFASEYLNEWAANNHHRFSGEQYFDSAGFFIFVVFAAPIILNCLLIVVMWFCEVWEAMGDLVRAKSHRQRDSSAKKRQ